jgi:hypothetical protein
MKRSHEARGPHAAWVETGSTEHSRGQKWHARVALGWEGPQIDLAERSKLARSLDQEDLVGRVAGA